MFLKMDLSADILKEICRDFTSISSKLLSVSMGNIYYISFDKNNTLYACMTSLIYLILYGTLINAYS